MTRPSRTGQYRIKRQAAGTAAFAQVAVEVHPASDGSTRTSWAVDPDRTGSAQPRHHRAEVDAALSGAASALHDLELLGVDTAATAVHVTRLLVNDVDTTPDAVAAAAAAATVAAFGVADLFEVVHDDQGWQCRPRM